MERFIVARQLLVVLVILVALFDGKTTMYEGVPPYVSVIIFFILMGVVGMMEGMQIALFAVVNLPEDELKSYPVAFKAHSHVLEATCNPSSLDVKSSVPRACSSLPASLPRATPKEMLISSAFLMVSKRS